MTKQDNVAGWQIETNQINPNHYFGAMTANGMIGLIGDAEPLHIKEVILNGVYDRYQRGRVSNILQGFNPFNIDIAVDEHHLGKDHISAFRQSLHMQEATLRTSFETKKISVRQEVVALRNLPYCGMVTLEITAKEDATITVFNNLIAPDHLRDVRNFYIVKCDVIFFTLRNAM